MVTRKRQGYMKDYMQNYRAKRTEIYEKMKLHLKDIDPEFYASIFERKKKTQKAKKNE